LNLNWIYSFKIDKSKKTKKKNSQFHQLKTNINYCQFINFWKQEIQKGLPLCSLKLHLSICRQQLQHTN